MVAGTLPETKKALVFAQVLQHVLADAKNATVLRLSIRDDGLQWGRISIGLTQDKIPLGPIDEPKRCCAGGA
jgi:hypothetical protein